MDEISLAFSGIQTAAVVGGIVLALAELRHMREQRRTELETRQAQLFMQLYDRWTFDIGEKFWDFLNVETRTGEEWREKFKTDRNYLRMASILSRWHEGVGVLVRFGLLDIKYIAHLASWPTRAYWEKLKPIIEDVRKLQGNPRSGIESEYLYNRLMDYMDRHPELKT